MGQKQEYDDRGRPLYKTISQPRRAKSAQYVSGTARVRIHYPPDPKPPAAAPAAAAPAPKAKPKPKPKPKPIEHSPEIQQAKERVNKYESDILSGKTSENIYAKDSYTVKSAANKYNFDATQGASGIGGLMDSGLQEPAQTDAESFMNSKKSELKSNHLQ